MKGRTRQKPHAYDPGREARARAAKEGCCSHFSAHRSKDIKACIVLFEPGAHHLPICEIRASKSMARRLRHARAKHADRQHRASQRCIFIAPEHTLMKRILNASPPVRPATSQALGTLHDESNGKSAEDIRLSIALRAAPEAKSVRRRMKLFQCMEFAQGRPGVLISVADCHSPRLARRSCSPRHGRRRTNERTAGASASEPSRDSTSSKFPADWQTSSGVHASTGAAAARLALRQR